MRKYQLQVMYVICTYEYHLGNFRTANDVKWVPLKTEANFATRIVSKNGSFLNEPPFDTMVQGDTSHFGRKKPRFKKYYDLNFFLRNACHFRPFFKEFCALLSGLWEHSLGLEIANSLKNIFFCTWLADVLMHSLLYWPYWGIIREMTKNWTILSKELI